jgi:hypothetical protein
VLLTPADDPRLVPGYLLSDDPQVESVAFELGQGRPRVLSRLGRVEAADRWYAGSGGPDTAMARQAPGRCGTCGFFVTLAGSLQGAFGVCANELAASDGAVVSVDHGCGAHSEAVADLEAETAGDVFDDSELEFGSTAGIAEFDEPAPDELEQVGVDIEADVVDAIDSSEPEAVDSDDQPGGVEVGDGERVEADGDTSVDRGVE